MAFCDPLISLVIKLPSPQLPFISPSQTTYTPRTDFTTTLYPEHIPGMTPLTVHPPLTDAELARQSYIILTIFLGPSLQAYLSLPGTPALACNHPPPAHCSANHIILEATGAALGLPRSEFVDRTGRCREDVLIKTAHALGISLPLANIYSLNDANDMRIRPELLVAFITALHTSGASPPALWTLEGDAVPMLYARFQQGTMFREPWLYTSQPPTYRALYTSPAPCTSKPPGMIPHGAPNPYAAPALEAWSWGIPRLNAAWRFPLSLSYIPRGRSYAGPEWLTSPNRSTLAKTFHPFSRLDAKLRARIWRLTLPRRGRYVISSQFVPGPTALSVTHESRAVALAHYTLVPPTDLTTTRPNHARIAGYFDFQQDWFPFWAFHTLHTDSLAINIYLDTHLHGGCLQEDYRALVSRYTWVARVRVLISDTAPPRVLGPGDERALGICDVVWRRRRRRDEGEIEQEERDVHAACGQRFYRGEREGMSGPEWMEVVGQHANISLADVCARVNAAAATAGGRGKRVMVVRPEVKVQMVGEFEREFERAPR